MKLMPLEIKVRDGEAFEIPDGWGIAEILGHDESEFEGHTFSFLLAEKSAAQGDPDDPSDDDLLEIAVGLLEERGYDVRVTIEDEPELDFVRAEVLPGEVLLEAPTMAQLRHLIES
jgi:hypothetical protein